MEEQRSEQPDKIPARFSSTLPIIVLTRPENEAGADWQELDRGPGYFNAPDGHEVRVRLKAANDEDVRTLVNELRDLPVLHFLDLAENRNVTNEGLRHLRGLPQLTGLNLSSCSITNTGIEHLRGIPQLSHLNLSYCNKLSDPALKTIEAMKNLTFVDLQGCLSITNGGLSRIRRRSLQIYRG